MNNLKARFITAVVAATIATTAIVLSPLGLWLFGVVVSLVGLWEFMSLMGIEEKRYRYSTILYGSLIWLVLLGELLNWLATPENLLLLLVFLLLPFFEIITLFNPKEKRPVALLSGLILGFYYCFLPLVLLLKLTMPTADSVYDFRIPFYVLLLTWGLDTAAYFVGKKWGKHPLFPRISPKKTWEGAIGGAVFCILLGVLFQYTIAEGMTANWIIAALIISIFSQLGDLVESMLKRQFDKKDSGNALPGHGGMLDRFDGLFLSVPFLYLYFSLL